MTNKEIESLIYDWGTYNEHGFNKYEEDVLLEYIGKEHKLNMDKYHNAMMGNTCMMDQHGFVTYHCDILTAVLCAIENRDMYMHEWD